MKANKDEVRTIDSSDGSIFNSRGYTIDSQMQMVEIAQFQDAHKMEVIKNTLDHLTNRNKLLLKEHLQQFNLAKMICPQYYPENEHWKRVLELSSDIDKVKKEMATKEEKKIGQMRNTSNKKMAEQFLASVTTSNDDFKSLQNKSTRKQKLDDSDGHTMDVDCVTIMVEENDYGTITSKDSPALSNSTSSNSVT